MMNNEVIERLKNITSLTLADMRNPEKTGIMLDAINDGIVAIKELEEEVQRERNYCQEWQQQSRELQQRIKELEAFTGDE